MVIIQTLVLTNGPNSIVPNVRPLPPDKVSKDLWKQPLPNPSPKPKPKSQSESSSEKILDNNESFDEKNTNNVDETKRHSRKMLR